MGHVKVIFAIALALADVRLVRRIQTESDASYAVASSDGAQAYVAHGTFVGAYDLKTGKRVAEFAGCRDIEALAVSGKYLVFGGTRCLGVAILPGGRVSTFEVPGFVRSIAIARDNTSVYVASRREGLYKFDLVAGELQPLETGYVTEGVALSPDGTSLYVSFRDGGPGGRRGHDVVGIYDTATGKRAGVIAGLANVGDRMAVSPDGKTLWALGLDACSSRAYDHAGCPVVPGGILNIIDIAKRQLIRAIGLPGPLHPHAVRFVPNRPWAVLTGSGLTFIDTATHQILFHDPALQTRDIFFDPSGRTGYVALPQRSALGVLQLPRETAISQTRSRSSKTRPVRTWKVVPPARTVAR